MQKAATHKEIPIISKKPQAPAEPAPKGQGSCQCEIVSVSRVLVRRRGHFGNDLTRALYALRTVRLRGLCNDVGHHDRSDSNFRSDEPRTGSRGRVGGIFTEPKGMGPCK